MRPQTRTHGGVKTKSFSIQRSDLVIFKRLAKEAKSHQPRVTESALLIQILKDYFFVKDSVRTILQNDKEIPCASTP